MEGSTSIKTGEISQGVLSENYSSQEEDDSDDNFLYDPPAALLQDLPPLRSKDPVQVPKSSDTSVSESDEYVCSHSQVGVKKLKYSLDQIVQRNKSQIEKDAGLANLQESLRHGIVKGGITKLIDDEEEGTGGERKLATEQKGQEVQEEGTEIFQLENTANTALLPEHEETLQQYALENERIAALHPGEDVFCNSNIGQLFLFPVQLSLPYKANAMEKLLMTSSPVELEELIKCGTVLDTYQVKQCPDTIMLWLLQLLSISDNDMVAGMIFDTMWSLMNTLQHLHPTAKLWCPTLQDIATIFINYGARLDSLLPPSCLHRGTHFTVEDIMSCHQKEKGDQSSSWAKPSCVPDFNLKQVIKIITQCLVNQHGGPSLSEADLISLAYLVCKVALDKQLVRCPILVDVHLCIAAILNCFQDDTWSIQASKLCGILTHCSDHHHNLVHLVRLVQTDTHRGKCVCTMLSFAVLGKLTGKTERLEEQGTKDIGKFKVSDLIPLLAACKPRSRTNIDYYHLHSLITLVELAVGNNKEVFLSSDKEALVSLVVLLRDVAGDIRESHKHLCRTQVKDLIIRIASKLTYIEQTLTSKQTYLHTYVKYERSEDAENVDASGKNCHGNSNSGDKGHENKDDDDDDDDDDVRDSKEDKITES